jgi:hypothetical protein
VNVCERLFAFFLFVALLPVLVVSAVIVVALSGRAPFKIWVVKLPTMSDRRAGPNTDCTVFERISDSRGRGGLL